MSTQLNNARRQGDNPLHADPSFSCAIITADWNDHITAPLRDGAIATLRQAGVSDENIQTFAVPGTVELVYAASRVIATLHPSAVIVIGCVIRGDTPHFDYVCQSATQGVTMLNASGDVPVIFSVLTVDTEEQALERAGGRLGNKGSEGAATAMAMARLATALPQKK